MKGNSHDPERMDSKKRSQPLHRSRRTTSASVAAGRPVFYHKKMTPSFAVFILDLSDKPAFHHTAFSNCQHIAMSSNGSWCECIILSLHSFSSFKRLNWIIEYSTHTNFVKICMSNLKARFYPYHSPIKVTCFTWTVIFWLNRLEKRSLSLNRPTALRLPRGRDGQATNRQGEGSKISHSSSRSSNLLVMY